MFLNNKYTEWYYNIIENSKKKNKDGYLEKHYIIPKSLNGRKFSFSYSKRTFRLSLSFNKNG